MRILQIPAFVLYYIRLRVKVANGQYTTTNRLGIAWRWRHWDQIRKQIIMFGKSKPNVAGNEAGDVPLDATEEVVVELVARGELSAVVDLLETMEETRPGKVPDVYSAKDENLING